jgi:hypothetical protein
LNTQPVLVAIEMEKHKSRSTEFDARIFPVIQGHFVIPGGHLLRERLNTDSYVSINFHSLRGDCHKERIIMNLEGGNEFVSNLFFFDANDVNLQMLKPKVGVKTREACFTKTQILPLIGKINLID